MCHVMLLFLIYFSVIIIVDNFSICVSSFEVSCSFFYGLIVFFLVTVATIKDFFVS